MAQSKVIHLETDLAARALQTDLVSGLAGKQNLIADGGLAQSKVTNLVTDLGAKASLQLLSDGLATKQGLIGDGTLSQAKVANLETDLAARALQADLVSGLAGKVDTATFLEGNNQRILADTLLQESKHPLITPTALLSQSLVDGFTTSLAGKPSFQQLNEAIATGHPTIQDGSLTSACTDGLQGILDE